MVNDASADLVEVLLSESSTQPGADAAAVARVEDSLGVKFPLDYSEFLFRSNGVDGPLGDGWVILWSIDELVQRNADQGVRDSLPDATLIGTDGGGEGYALIGQGTNARYVVVPLLSFAQEESRLAGASFGEFLQCIADVSW